MQSELVFGFHAVKTTLKYDAFRVQRIMLLKGREDERLNQLLEEAGDISVERVSRPKLDELAQGGVHQGVIAF
ncbi:MAG: RNA methyltransferase substrate-binding domain-containing protein, partial [Pseudomonadales bacterium]